MHHRHLVLFVLTALAWPLLAQEAQPHEAFMTKFEEAAKADNYAVMKDLVLKNQPHLQTGYFLYEYQYASAVSNKNEEDRVARLGVLEKLATFAKQEFKDAWFVERLAYAKTITPEQAAKYVTMQDAIVEGANTFRRGEKSGDKKDWTDAQVKFLAAAPVAKEIGDVYWQMDASVWLGSIAEKLEEKFDAAFYYKRATEIAREHKQALFVAKYDLGGRLKRFARDGMRDDLIDVTIPVGEAKTKYAQTIEKLAAEAAGGGADSRAGGAPGGPKGAMPSTLPPMPNKHTARIEWVDAEKPKYAEAAARPQLTPNYRANAHWFMWYSIDVGGPAKTTIVPGEHLLQNEKGKILFDPDGAGKTGDERIKVALGKPDVVVFKNRDFPDGSKVEVRHVMMERPRSFTINGIGLSLKAGGPNDPIALQVLGASSLTTKVDGHQVTIYDDSANGDFSNYGDDSMVIGKGKTARVVPLSRYVYLGDLLFEMKIDPNGQNIRFKPYDGPVALIEFKYVASSTPAFMILEGLNEHAQSFFNLMDCKDKPMWVPAGEYKFRNGYFSFGKEETIVVNAGPSTTSLKVAEGQLTKCEMGAAKEPGFTYSWKAELEKDKGRTYVKIKGKDIKVFGCAGEEYSYFYSGQFRPTVKMRIGKDGAVFYDKQMKHSANEDLGDKTPWPEVVFFPKNLEVEKTASGDAFVNLEGEYPKLGKITSKPQQVQ